MSANSILILMTAIMGGLLLINVSAQMSAAQICANWGAVGLYPNPDDTSCQQYARCFMNGGLKGAFYNCTGTTLFNPQMQLCDKDFKCTASLTTTTVQPTTTTVPTTPTTTTVPTIPTTTTVPTTPGDVPGIILP